MNNKWDQVESTNFRGLETYIFHETLSNGQVLGAYFQLEPPFTFNYAVTIRDSKEACIGWLGSGDDAITGNCGLEGLAKAHRILRYFMEHRLEDGYVIKVHGESRRGKAYRILKRLGFKVIHTSQEESQYEFEK